MKKPLKRTEIDLYLTTSDESKKNLLERQVLSDDFERDALDGFDELGLQTNALRSLDRKFIPRSYTGWIIASSVVFVSILVLWLLPKEQTIYSHVYRQNQPVKLDRTEVILPPHIDTLQALPKSTQIEAKQLVKDFIDLKELEASEEPFTVNDLSPMPLTESNSNKTDVETIAKKQLSGKEIYLHDLKLLDYRAYRSKPKIKTEQLTLTGIPAELESGASNKESEWQSVEVPYIEFIERTMELFSKGSYKKALNRFEVILTTYPDDLNALFYSGLCYYNLQNSAEAVSCFEKCLDSGYSNFNEEAEWYYALSLFQANETERAKKVLQRIVSSKGFYAEQAKKKWASL